MDHSKHIHEHTKKSGNIHKHEHGKNHHANMINDFKKRLIVSLLITIPIIVLAPMIQELLGYSFHFKGDSIISFVLSVIVFFYGGWPFLKGMIDEIKKKSPGMMTLIALAISVAFFYSSAVVFGLDGKIFFWELVSLIDIMLIGHIFEMKSVMSASGALQELAKLIPDVASRINADGGHDDIPVSDLKIDDVILVRPGEKIPADGIIINGNGQVNESMLTGESVPVLKKQNDKVIGGSINVTGALKIKVEHTGSDNFLSKVIELVKVAQDSKSKTQNLANRAAGWLFYTALISGVLTLAIWLWIGKDFEYALERMVTVMIISCPHALGLAVPLVVAISTTVSAQNGLLIRNRTAFENSRKITTVIFDKTGTLTKGSFGVTQIKSLDSDLTDNELLKIVASLESKSEHPIASGIILKAKELELELEELDNFQNLTGRGLKATLNGVDYYVVSPGYLNEKEIDYPDDAINDGTETVIFILRENKLLGYISLADVVREESYESVRILKEHGINVLMATGDNDKVAKAVSESLKLDSYYAEVLPEDKQKIIKELQEKGEVVAMTGDGVNDAPALAQADVGIAVGSGTDVAAETADIILVNSNPNDIVKLILFGKETYKKIMQNLWWAAGYNILAVPLAAGVLAGAGFILSPAVGAILMSISTIIVALNAQLLRRKIF